MGPTATNVARPGPAPDHPWRQHLWARLSDWIVRWIPDDHAREEFLSDLAGAVVLLVLGFTQYAFKEPSRLELVDPRVRLLMPLLIVLACAPLAWRRRRPVLAMLLVSAGALGYGAWPETIAIVIVLFSAARYVPTRRWPLALGATLLVAAANVAVDAHHSMDTWAIARDAAAVAALWAGGETSRRAAPRLAARQARQAAAKLAEERRPLVEERARIARELHDVIAHGVSVMVVQAGAAETVLDRDPAKARASLESIAATGRQSLDEMRRLLGVLRSGDDGDAPAMWPQPGVGRLEALAAQTRQAGLGVHLVVDGDEVVAPSVDLCVYRIAQEALTNVMKHSGASAVTVTVTTRPEQVEILVQDNGRGSSGRDTPKSGQGVVGMRERVGLFAGTFSAGPAPTGGWEVRAVLPVQGVHALSAD